MSTDVEKAPALRDRFWFRIALLAVIGVLIFISARACGSGDISSEEAIEIAKREIAFVPDEEQVRFNRTGLAADPQWVVGLAQFDESGQRVNATTIVVDANSGEVLEVRVDGPTAPIEPPPE